VKRFFVGTVALMLWATTPGQTQSMDELNIQIHGYATQGFLYTTQNNIFTTDSSDGSPAWTEAVINIGAQPTSKLRIAVQGRYFLLGNFGNAITLDWAAADYKSNEHFGVRVGKVKTPSGLFNEIQDIDPAYLWSLLPQGAYPITSRNSVLAHDGGVVYGAVSLGRRFGKLEYRGWGGERVIGAGDGVLIAQTEAGFVLPNGLSGVTYGEAIHWRTPLAGLMIGASNGKNVQWRSQITFKNGAFTGTEVSNPLNRPSYFAIYEKNKIMVATEYNRLPANNSIQLIGLPPSPSILDNRAWYAMASYKVSDKLIVGLYDSQFVNHAAPLGPPRFQKDWTLSGRYDFNQFLYAKAEEHFIDGTGQGYDTTLNPGGLKPDTRLTVLKAGVSF
jgi:hypothetical protein